METNSLTDTDLWQRVRQDDSLAFEWLYRRYMKVLYAAIHKWTESQEEAEDILQEVFLDIWEKRRTIIIRQSVFSYLYSITRYKVFDHLKGKKISQDQLRAWNIVQEEAVMNKAFEQDTLENIETGFSDEIDRLPEQMKNVYRLSVEEGKSIQEIADALLVSPFTIKNHLQKIRKRLRAAAIRLTSFFLYCLFLFFLRG